MLYEARGSTFNILCAEFVEVCYQALPVDIVKPHFCEHSAHALAESLTHGMLIRLGTWMQKLCFPADVTCRTRLSNMGAARVRQPTTTDPEKGHSLLFNCSVSKLQGPPCPTGRGLLYPSRCDGSSPMLNLAFNQQRQCRHGSRGCRGHIRLELRAPQNLHFLAVEHGTWQEKRMEQP